MEKTNILFPVETISRELDYRLFLAAKIVNPNRRVFVGQYDVLNNLVQRTRGGIYVGKNVFDRLPTDISTFVRLKEHGYKLIHHDEEGAVYHGDEEDWKETLITQVNPGYLCSDDYICTWGDFQAEYYRSRKPACLNNIVSTGHPRFDLCKPEYRELFRSDVESLKEQYGDFILFNTNFSLVNNGLGFEDTFSSRWHYEPSDVENRTKLLENWAHKSKAFANTIKLINRLSGAFQGTKLIIRPHPSEDISTYETILGDFDNVEIIRAGPVAPWILASRLLIHDGCTTAIEAFLADKPVISYQSVQSNKNNLFLPNSIGLCLEDEDEMVRTVRKVLDSEISFDKTKPLPFKVHNLLKNLKEDSFTNLIKIIEKAEDELKNERQEFAWNRKLFAIEEQVRLSKDTAKSFVRPLFKKKQRDFNYYRSKFQGFDAQIVERKTNKIKDMLNRDFKVNRFNERLLIIEE